MNRDFKDYTIDELIETVVDLEAVFIGVDTPQRNIRHINSKCVMVDGDTSVTSVLEDELFTTRNLCMMEGGNLVGHYTPLENDDVAYIIRPAFSGFPNVNKELNAYCLREHGDTFSSLQLTLDRRLNNKPLVIDMFNDALNHARKMKACAVLENEGEARDAFYEKQEDDYGMF